MQLRRHLYGPRVFNIPWVGKFDLALNGVAFLDSGALMDCVSEISDSKFEFTGGLGVEILSPIQDIVRVELAGDGEGFIAFYFTSGVRF